MKKTLSILACTALLAAPLRATLVYQSKIAPGCPCTPNNEAPLFAALAAVPAAWITVCGVLFVKAEATPTGAKITLSKKF